MIFKILFKIFGVKETDNPVMRYGKDIFVGMYFVVIYDWILLGCVDTPEEIAEKINQGFVIALDPNKT